MVWREQPWFQPAYEKYGRSVAGIPEVRCFFLQSAIRSLSGVPGAVAECGTRNGKSALYMPEACVGERPFYLFDSFEGLSDPVAGKDTLRSAFSDTGKRIFESNFPAVERRLAPFPQVHIMKGWIPDRFAEVAHLEFCLVHIDVDLYRPILHSLEFFYGCTVRHGHLR